MSDAAVDVSRSDSEAFAAAVGVCWWNRPTVAVTATDQAVGGAGVTGSAGTSSSLPAGLTFTVWAQTLGLDVVGALGSG